MSAAAKIVALHLVSLVLCSPLLMAFMASSESGAVGLSWALLGAGLVYVLSAVMGKPEVLFAGVGKFGLEKRSAKLAIATVACIFISVVFLDAGGAGALIGLALLAAASVQFVLAIKSTYDTSSI